jgi:hypothetical protein
MQSTIPKNLLGPTEGTDQALPVKSRWCTQSMASVNDQGSMEARQHSTKLYQRMPWFQHHSSQNGISQGAPSRMIEDRPIEHPLIGFIASNPSSTGLRLVMVIMSRRE